MDKKIDAAEVRNPKLTLERRMREADGERGGGGSDSRPGGLVPPGERDTGQSKFLYPPGSKPRDRNPDGLKRLLEKRKFEQASSADEFEGAFREGTDDPLTDAVRASRKAAVASRQQEDAEYKDAYNA